MERKWSTKLYIEEKLSLKGKKYDVLVFSREQGRGEGEW